MDDGIEVFWYKEYYSEVGCIFYYRDCCIDNEDNFRCMVFYMVCMV